MPTLPPRARKRLPPSQRRQLILDVAYEEFARLGYEGVSMDRLASKMGVTKPILYRHFASKEALCAECGRRMAGLMLDAVRLAAGPSLPPDGQLWGGILAQLRFIAEHHSEWRVYVIEAPLRGGRAATTLAEGRAAVIDLLANLIAQAITTAGRAVPPRLELEAQAHALQGAVEQIAQWWEAHPEQPLEMVALRVMNFAWQGFGDILEGRLWIPPGGPEAQHPG